MLELHHFRVQSRNSLLHAQRTNLRRGGRRDHAALVAGAVGRKEGVLRIFPRQFFAAAALSVKYAERSRGRNCFAAAPSGSRNSTSLSSREMTPSSARKLTIGSYSEERRRFRSESTKKVARPPTICGAWNAGARMVVGFDDDISARHAGTARWRLRAAPRLSVIGQHTDGVKILSSAALVGGKKFLHRVRGVRAIVKIE